jgi:hypothetical protein
VQAHHRRVLVAAHPRLCIRFVLRR